MRDIAKRIRARRRLARQEPGKPLPYKKACGDWFWLFLIAWERLGDHLRSMGRDLKDLGSAVTGLAGDLLILVIILLGPLLALLAPFVGAFILQADAKQRARQRAAAEERLRQHYGRLAQKLKEPSE